jgi:monoamine oxidase
LPILKVLDVTRSEVAIVGGGLAGLYAARLLHKAGVNFILLEARDRLGGRILSVNASGRSSEDGFDLGPSWYWPQMQPAMGALVEELGLPAFDQNSDGDVVFERMSRETPQRYRGTGADQQSMRLVGGTAALVQALALELPSEKLFLGMRVTAMTLVSGGVELTVSRNDGATRKHVAQRAIAALPPRLLEATVVFAPGQEAATAQLWRETATWMAPHAKFFALYDRPFWRNANLSGTAQSVVGPMIEIHDATTASGSAALFGFLGIGAEQRAILGDQALRRACLDQLARIFGPEASEAHATLLKDWAADPLTATAADRGAGGHLMPGNAVWVSGPWQKRLALAGSETSPSESGYLAGAMEAAKRAAAEILSKLQVNDQHG